MIIATWNVNSVLARLPLVLRWLEEARPDVVCLQELKCADERFPAAEFDMKVSSGALVLNGSGSEDPEGGALTFYWYDQARSGTNLCGTLPQGIPTDKCIGKGLVYKYTPPASGNRTMYLIVADPGGIWTQAPSQTACVGTCP